MDGTFEHADSHGGGGVITNGDTQWMTAGGGLLHIERPPESLVVSGGLFHGLQLWVNLPRADKWLEPKYQDLRAGESTLLTTHDGGALLRVIAGERGRAHRSRLHVHPDDHDPRDGRPRRDASGCPGGATSTRWSTCCPATARSAPSGARCAPGRPRCTAPATRSRSPRTTRQESRLAGLDVIVLGGRPIREPVAWAGPFVMNTRAEVLQAFEDYQRGKLGVIPASYVPHGSAGGTA